MWESIKTWGTVTVSSLSMVACFGIMAVEIPKENAERCVARWSASGLASRWDSKAGCMVEHKQGLWVVESYMLKAGAP